MAMGSSRFICEIVEPKDESNLVHSSDGSSVPNFKLKECETDGGSRSYVEDELNQLIKSFNLKGTRRVVGPSRQKGADILGKSALKKPIKVRISESSGIGTADSVTLKQALRKLCISQASEMAAGKRLSKPVGVLGPDSDCIQKLYASVVVQASDSGLPLDGEQNSVEVSVVPKKVATDSSVKATQLSKDSKPHSLQLPSKIVISSSRSTVSTKAGALKTTIQDMIKTESSDIDVKSSAVAKVGIGAGTTSEMSISNSQALAESGKTCKISFPIKLVKNKSFAKKKGKRESTSTNDNSNKCGKINGVDAVSCKTKVAPQKSSVFSGFKGKNIHGESGKKNKSCCGTYPDSTPKSCNIGRTVCEKTSGISRLREKGECSQSSKSSLGDYRSSTSISDESHQSGSSGNGSRPHMSKDVRWISIRSVMMQHGSLGLKNFKLLKRLGCGDIGTVYLAELIGLECLFALKVMDIGYLVSRKKMLRAQTEREILQMLDHPFLPTLYAHFTTDNLSCLVMEYCPGGDLHVLRQKQLCRSFSEPAARFYVAEVLLALEYLHMLGVVYRDLKPENILVREDGHIMLSDFDLSLRCTGSASLLRSSSVCTQEPAKRQSGPCPENSCIDPLCLHPSTCFSPRIVSAATKNRKQNPDAIGQARPLPQLVVEPTDARSNSFVGTHEYLAPEIIRGDGHGSAVDWWTFGIFLFELLFGRTPFKGPGNEETMANVVSQGLRFPENPPVSLHARDLIRGLLIKEPENRLGSVRGAAEIKKHPFFEGLNWALIRCTAPPETPTSFDVGAPAVVQKKKDGKCLDFRSNGEDVEFELF